jgi:glucan biosynthesis protein C
VLRLLVPFLFGVLVIIVPQTYYELVYRDHLPCTRLLDCYFLYLLNLPERFAHFSFYHLWFLAVLFIFSLLCLPLFLGLSKKGKGLASLLATGIHSPWKLMLSLVFPLALLNIFVYPGTFWGSRDFGGWSICAHLLFFVSGYRIFADPGNVEQMRKMGIFLLAGSVGAALALRPLVTFLIDWKSNFGSAGYAVAQTVQALLSWCLLISFINLGGRFLTSHNRFLAYANQAVLPFYILHQTVIISVGYYVVQWEMNPALKYLVIALISFSLIMAIYDLLIKRIKILRFLLGMRPIR